MKRVERSRVSHGGALGARAKARLRCKSRFNVADRVVALTYGFGLDPRDSDRDASRIAARAGPAAGQLAKVTIHAFAELCTANRRVVRTLGGTGATLIMNNSASGW